MDVSCDSEAARVNDRVTQSKHSIWPRERGLMEWAVTCQILPEVSFSLFLRSSPQVGSKKHQSSILGWGIGSHGQKRIRLTCLELMVSPSLFKHNQRSQDEKLLSNVHKDPLVKMGEIKSWPEDLEGVMMVFSTPSLNVGFSIQNQLISKFLGDKGHF